MGLVTVDRLTDAITSVTNYMEDRMAKNENELWEHIATRTGVVMAELKSAQESIVAKDAALAEAADALAGVDDRIAEAVREALALDAQLDTARLIEHLSALGEEIPADVPVVETPAAGEPAEIPADSGVVPVDEDALPVTEAPAAEAPAADDGAADDVLDPASPASDGTEGAPDIDAPPAAPAAEGEDNRPA